MLCTHAHTLHADCMFVDAALFHKTIAQLVCISTFYATLYIVLVAIYIAITFWDNISR